MAAAKHSLHFYPDETRLDVQDKSGTVVASFRALGGDPVKANAKPGEDGYGEGYEETRKGTFLIAEVKPHVSPGRWPWSTTAWEQKVQIRPKDWKIFSADGKDLNLQTDKEDFESAYADRPDILAAAARGETVYVPYRFNDFGHISIKTTYITGPKAGRINDHFLHTTPKTEWPMPPWLAAIHFPPEVYHSVFMQHSHGCIHVTSEDIDAVIKYIEKGKTYLTVH